jgi:hypothetical protein
MSQRICGFAICGLQIKKPTIGGIFDAFDNFFGVENKRSPFLAILAVLEHDVVGPEVSVAAGICGTTPALNILLFRLW